MSFKENVKVAFTAKKRFEWLDQFRGLVILIFIIQTSAKLLYDATTIHIFAPHLLLSLISKNKVEVFPRQKDSLIKLSDDPLVVYTSRN